ncbi:MAG: TonB-system energizer ExbB [uncultured Campylobacterales bacterium]|uniref:TonB-system energizer ExbB n=1 Tax=uncultured Campylobacterales bacterium TaxID=352960 RepID=A0A6S6SY22_9BACT|nr:MAG: TonB-system energizer ExbB [uncultured Campylobacterales bacterium]
MMKDLGLIVDYGVIGILLVLSLLSLFFFIERLISIYNIDMSKEKNPELSLTKNTTFISIVASNAAYIGLLGTVLAIMQTFYEMGSLESAKIMMSLSLALKTTAIGLAVAIEATVLYNILARLIERKLSSINEKI